MRFTCPILQSDWSRQIFSTAIQTRNLHKLSRPFLRRGGAWGQGYKLVGVEYPHYTCKIEAVSIFLNVVAFTELMTHCKIEAAQWIRMRGHLFMEWHTIHSYIYIHTYIDRGGRRLTSVGLAQARPNDNCGTCSGSSQQLQCACAESIYGSRSVHVSGTLISQKTLKSKRRRVQYRHSVTIPQS